MKKIFKLTVTLAVLIVIAAFADFSANALSFDTDLQYQTESLATLYRSNEASYPPFMNSGPQGPQFKTEMTSTSSFK